MVKKLALDKSEILSFLKQEVSPIFTVEVEGDGPEFRINILLNDIYCVTHSFYSAEFDFDLNNLEDVRALTRIQMRLKEELSRIVDDYFKSVTDELSKNKRFYNIFQDKFKEKDIYFSVKKWNKLDYGNGATYNLEAYYYELVKNKIPFLNKLWEILIKKEIDHKNINELQEYVHGAFERFKQIFFNYDIICNLYEKGESNNDIWFLYNINICNFITMIKTLGDNLAWIIYYYYDFRLNKYNLELNNRAFKSDIETKSKNIYDIIYMNKGYSTFEKIIEFRDIIQHRHALHVELVQLGTHANAVKKIMVPVDPTDGVLADAFAPKRPEHEIRGEASNLEGLAKNGLKTLVVLAHPSLYANFTDVKDFYVQHLDFIFEVYEKTAYELYNLMTRMKLGEIEHYYNKPNVAVLTLENNIQKGDSIMIECGNTCVYDSIISMEIDHFSKEALSAGNRVGIKINNKARKGCTVYKIKT